MLTVFAPVLLLVKASLLVAERSSWRAELLIYPNIKHILAPVTKPLFITCEVRASDEGKATDEDEGGMLTNMKWLNEYGTEITENVAKTESTLQLTFLNPSLDDSGAYKCTAGYAKELEARVLVEFYVPITFEDCPKTHDFILGKPGNITCRAAANPKPVIIWHKDGKPIDLQEYDLDEFVLTIPSVSEEDRGIYTAEAYVKETGRYLRQNIQVNVITPPKITDIPEEVTIIQGVNNTIKCGATGSEPLSYTWYNDYPMPVTEDHYRNIGHKVDQGLLTISKFYPDYMGKYYMCEVSNPAGKDQAYVKINIQTSEICSKTCADVDMELFPRTEDELRKICTTEVENLKCKIQYYQVCPGKELTLRRVIDDSAELAAIQELYCTENTLFHAVLVDNTKCFRRIPSRKNNDMEYMQFFKECIVERSVMLNISQKNTQALLAEGLISVTDDKYGTDLFQFCMMDLNMLACHAVKIGEECGAVAMHLVEEILLKLKQAWTICREYYPLLPAVARLWKTGE